MIKPQFLVIQTILVVSTCKWYGLCIGSNHKDTKSIKFHTLIKNNVFFKGIYYLNISNKVYFIIEKLLTN